MITNAREYQITRTQLTRLTDAFVAGQAESPPAGVHQSIYNAGLLALKSEIERLTAEIAEYEALLVCVPSAETDGKI